MTSDNDKAYSRRQVVGGVALGAAGLATGGLATGMLASVSPASALTANTKTGATMANTALPLDHYKQYPKPPFKPQEQEWPGLASKMDPKPDHGETSYKGSGRLTGRKALITGGDSGMGRAAAVAYAREGADVAINYFPTEESDAQEVIALIRAEGRKGIALPGDLRDEAFCGQLIKQAVEQLGGLDIFVSNAGKQATQPTIADITTEQFDWTFKTNVYAMFWLTKAVVPHLPTGASIIVTASEQAENPSQDLVDYAMTKACNVSFVKSMAKQLGEKGIRVNAVAPGPVWTPLQVAGGATAKKQKTFGGDTALGRAGQPAELASIYVQLAAADASYATGAVYSANGGGATHT